VFLFITHSPSAIYTLSLHDALPIFDSDRRRLLVEAESRKARRNKVSDEIARLKKEKQDASGLIAEMKQLAGEIQELDEKAKASRSEEHTSELQSRGHLVCRLLLEKK